MKVVNVTYSKTVQENKYEPACLTIEAAIEDGDKSDEAIQKLIQTTRHHLGLDVGSVAPVVEAAVIEAPAEVASPKEYPALENKKKKADAAAAKKKKADAVAKKKIITFTKYDRTLDPHKEMFADILTDCAPKWKESKEIKELAAKLSRELEGKDMYDDKGEMLSSFVNEIVDPINAILSSEEEGL